MQRREFHSVNKTGPLIRIIINSEWENLCFCCSARFSLNAAKCFFPSLFLCLTVVVLMDYLSINFSQHKSKSLEGNGKKCQVDYNDEVTGATQPLWKLSGKTPLIIIQNYSNEEINAVSNLNICARSLTSLSIVIFNIMLHTTSFVFLWMIFFEAEANSENQVKTWFFGGGG